MKNILKIAICLAVSLVSTAVLAQGVKDVKINEILVKNVSGYTDDHSEHSSWIELHNSGYAQANIAGCYLRLIQGGDTINYRIPKNDIRTNIAPQGYILFYASGSSNKGTFHTNFELMPSDSVKFASLEGINDRLEIVDQSGKNVIDFIEYDVNTQYDDVSFGWISNKDDEDVIEVVTLPSTTPLQSNEVHERIPKSELFRMEDPAGIAMAVIAMSVVFSALISLFLIFKGLGIFMQKQAAAKKAKAATPASAPVVTKTPIKTGEGEPTGEELAAITLALHQYYQELHDLESEIVTINRVARVYSPWSSKIHTLTRNPRNSR